MMQQNLTILQNRNFGWWKVCGRCIYGISSIKIGSLFAPKIKGQNLRKIIKKEIREAVWLEMAVKDALPFSILYNIEYAF